MSRTILEYSAEARFYQSVT